MVTQLIDSPTRVSRFLQVRLLDRLDQIFLYFFQQVKRENTALYISVI